MTHNRWPAPIATGPVDAVVTLPGSKSLTNRAVVIAALAAAPSRIRGPLYARDTRLMVNGLRALGTSVRSEGDSWLVGPGYLAGPAEVDCGLAGTVMRFLPPVAALADGDVGFDGDPRARQRPVHVLLRALGELGVGIDDNGRGALPFVVQGRTRVRGGSVTMDASA